jgi:hypothetical protein
MLSVCQYAIKLEIIYYQNQIIRKTLIKSLVNVIVPIYLHIIVTYGLKKSKSDGAKKFIYQQLSISCSRVKY